MVPPESYLFPMCCSFTAFDVQNNDSSQECEIVTAPQMRPRCARDAPAMMTNLFRLKFYE